MKSASAGSKIPTDDKCIHYLGFVVDINKPIRARLTHALVCMECDRSMWYVVDLPSGPSNDRIQWSVTRYFRSVFWLSVQAYQAYGNNIQLSPGIVLAEAKRLHHRAIARVLLYMNRSDKIGGASKYFPLIRTAVYHSLFGVRDVKNKDAMKVTWRGFCSPQQLFFWTPSQFANSPLAEAQGQMFRTTVIDGLAVGSSVDSQQLAAWVDSLPPVAATGSWQDLYLQSLVKNSCPEGQLRLKVVRQVGPTHGGETHGVAGSDCPVDAVDALKSIRHAVLLGASGSGKTTILMRLAGVYAEEHLAGAVEARFPLVGQLEHLGDNGVDDLKDVLVHSIRDIISQIEMPELQAWYTGYLGSRVTNGLRRGSMRQAASFSRATVLDAIGEDISIWLEDDKHLVESILLIDGFSNIVPDSETRLQQEWRKLGMLCSGMIVAAKELTSMLEDLTQLPCFQLQPVPECDMVAFLEYYGVKCPSDVIKDLSHRSPAFLELLGLPFYLDVFCQTTTPGCVAVTPDRPGTFIQHCVKSALQRKQNTGETGKRPFDTLQFNHILASMAGELVWQVARGRHQYLRYPVDCDQYGDRTSVEEVVRLGAKVGVLRITEDLFGRMRSGERIVFAHDLFRDSYAAMWFADDVRYDESHNRVAEYLEHKVWDAPIRMFFELTNDTSMSGAVLLEVSRHDPYFAAECTLSCEHVSDAIIAGILRHLKEWECDYGSAKQKLLSNAGVNAAKTLLRREPEKARKMIDKHLEYSLEFLALPFVLAVNDDKSLQDSLRRMTLASYQSMPALMCEAVASWNYRHAFDFVVNMVDELLSNSSAYSVEADLAGRLVRCVLYAAFRPNATYAKKIMGKLRSAAVRHAVLVRGELPIDELRDLTNSSDSVMIAIAEFKIAELANNRYDGFASRIRLLQQECLRDPACSLLLMIAAAAQPASAEPVISEWLNQELEKRGSVRSVSDLVTLLSICGTPSAVQTIARVLCDYDPATSRTTLCAQGLRESPVANDICSVLQENHNGQLGRESYIRYALGDSMTDTEVSEMWKRLSNAYVAICSGEDLVYSPDFELRAFCLLNRLSADHWYVPEDWDEDVLRVISPWVVPSIGLMRDFAEMCRLFESGTVESCRRAITTLTTSKHIGRFDVDSQLKVANAGRRCVDGEVLIQSLWEETNSAAKAGELQRARHLSYIAWHLQSTTGRRWLGYRCDWPPRKC